MVGGWDEGKLFCWSVPLFLCPWVVGEVVVMVAYARWFSGGYLREPTSLESLFHLCRQTFTPWKLLVQCCRACDLLCGGRECPSIVAVIIVVSTRAS